MKRLSLGFPMSDAEFPAWARRALRSIEEASYEDIETVFDGYTTTGTLTEARTFNAGTATITEVRNVLATLISDIRKRGPKRGYPD